MKKLSIAFLAGVLLPSIALAQSSGGNFTSIINTISNIVNLIIPLLVALALLAFFWGLVRYIWKSGDEDGQKEGKNIMIAGIVGLFVMVSIWGIISIIGNTFGIQSGGTVTPPSVNVRR